MCLAFPEKWGPEVLLLFLEQWELFRSLWFVLDAHHLDFIPVGILATAGLSPRTNCVTEALCYRTFYIIMDMDIIRSCMRSLVTCYEITTSDKRGSIFGCQSDSADYTLIYSSLCRLLVSLVSVD